METTFEKIKRKTGKKEISCKCKQCASQCRMPCLGTPEDMFKIIGAGYEKRVSAIYWDGAFQLGLYPAKIQMLTPLYDPQKQSCTFFTNGLCELHEKGLKPTEGKLSHHSTTVETFNPKKSLGWAVAKEWLDITEQQVKDMIAKYVHSNVISEPMDEVPF